MYMEVVQSSDEAMLIIDNNEEASGYMKWKPWVNTVAYFPLDSQYQLSDATWNFTPSSSSGVSITTLNWIECAFTNSNNQVLYSKNFSTWNNAHTWSFWIYRTSNSPEWSVVISTWYGTGTRAKVMWFHYQNLFFWGWNNDTYDTVEWPLNQRFNFIWTFDWSTSKCYYNATLVRTKSQTYSVDSNNSSSLFNQRITNTSWNQQTYWYVKDIIMEDRAWTQEECTKYVNKMKKQFWLT